MVSHRTRLRQLVPRRFKPAARAAFLHFGAATSQLRLEPSFLVIGGQRCGTTTIFLALAEHPQVARPPTEKGTDYYTLHFSHGRSWYRGHFPIAVGARRHTRARENPLAFEACTYYMFHPFALERIAHDFPGIKLVAMLRDPVERAYSAYKHELARGFESETNFERALDLEESRLAGEVDRMRQDVDYRSHAHRHLAYKSRGQFAEQLERAYALFSRDQVHVMESEAFFDQPGREYAKLVAFLELDQSFVPDIRQHNARPSSPMPESARRHLVHHFRPHDDALADLLGREPFWRSR